MKTDFFQLGVSSKHYHLKMNLSQFSESNMEILEVVGTQNILLLLNWWQM